MFSKKINHPIVITARSSFFSRLIDITEYSAILFRVAQSNPPDGVII